MNRGSRYEATQQGHSRYGAALALAARGFRVFPIRAKSKYPPLITNFPEKASSDAAAVDSWWRRWPTANIAIEGRGFIIVDVDVRAGGNDTLAKLELTHGLPATLTTITPTGGRHLFYCLPEGHPGVANGANKLGPGIDTKSTGGYVVAPGSEVPAGRYRFEADVPIADAPEWLLTKLGTTVPKTGMSTNRGQMEIVDAPADVYLRALDWIKTRPVGDEAFKTACGLRDFGLSLHQALQALMLHDGRPPEIIRPKVEHAYRYAQNEPGVRAASAEDFPVVDNAGSESCQSDAVKLTKPRAKALRLSELAKQPAGPYLVKGLLQRGSHAVGYGQPGAGKTFVFLDLAYHVAAGREWQGHRVRQGTALYLAYEGTGGMAKRAAALMRKYGDHDVPLFIMGADYNLREKDGRKALAEDLAQLPDKPALVVIDTLARAMKGGDENSAQDMGALNDAVSALIHATDACVLLIHHSGKNKASGARGSSALLGAIDTQIEVDSRQILTRKQRDVEPAAPLGFKLQPIPVGVDEDGDEIMSCTVEPTPPLAERLAGLSENVRLGLDVLVDLSPDNEPLHEELWRAKCREFLPEQDAAARKSFYRIKQALLKRGLVEKVPEGYQRRME